MSGFTIRLMFFFFNDTATTEIYTLSLHDALPISRRRSPPGFRSIDIRPARLEGFLDRKSTRLNSSHSQISYAVFCLKKKKIGADAGYAAGDERGKLLPDHGAVFLL